MQRFLLAIAPVALAACATTSELPQTVDLASWSVQALCDRKDDPLARAELERRTMFTPVELELITAGRIERGVDEHVMRCSLGEPLVVVEMMPGMPERGLQNVYSGRQVVTADGRVVSWRKLEQRVKTFGTSPAAFGDRMGSVTPY